VCCDKTTWFVLNLAGYRASVLGDIGMLMFLPFLMKLPLKTKSPAELVLIIIDAVLPMLKTGLGIVMLRVDS